MIIGNVVASAAMQIQGISEAQYERVVAAVILEISRDESKTITADRIDRLLSEQAEKLTNGA